MTDLESLESRKWEIDTYLRTGTIHLIHSATSTIQSLIQLLGDISYIVINDDVGDSIKNAYENILKAKASLKSNDLDRAVEFAKQAYRSAERAFFDQSLLALLYFPDEQKYIEFNCTYLINFSFHCFYFIDMPFTFHYFYQL